MNNIKIMKRIITLAIVAIVMTACTNRLDLPQELSKYITINANIDESVSRVVNNGNSSTFENGDKISVYAWIGGNESLPTTDGYVVNNSINTFDGTKWDANPKMLWKDGSANHYFLSIYPTRDISNTEYILESDGDLMVAHNFGEDNLGVIPSSAPVSLSFDHMMAKLRVNLTFRNQWDNTPTVTSVAIKAKSSATIDWLGKSVSASGNVVDINMQIVTANTTYETLIVPQTFSIVDIVIDGKTYRYNGSVSLTSGKVTTLNLNVGRDKVTLDGVGINPWIEGDIFNNCEAQENN